MGKVKARYHCALYCKYFGDCATDKGFDAEEKLKTLKEEELKKMKAEVSKTSSMAYLGCLLLMMADKKYKPVRKFLHKDFLVEKQQYPHNVLAMKQFMADFIRSDAGKPKW